MCLSTTNRVRDSRFRAELQRALGDVLRKVADPFGVACDADRADKLTKIDRRGQAARDGRMANAICGRGSRPPLHRR
jgi:hypothetical protein